MQFPIVIYWAVNMLLFAFMYGTNPFIPVIVWMIFMCASGYMKATDIITTFRKNIRKSMRQ